MSANLDRIAALLRKAETTDNAHEAESFMKKAQELATRDSIDLAVARMHQSDKEKRVAPIVKRISVGEKGKHGLAEFCTLVIALTNNNDIKVGIANNNQWVEMYGFESDMEVVELLFGSLMYQMEAACSAYIKSGAHKEETVDVYVLGHWTNDNNWISGHNIQKPLHGLTVRKNFQQAFVRAIARRLSEARMEAMEVLYKDEQGETTTQVNTGMELAIKTKKESVQELYQKQMAGVRGSWKGGKAVTHRSSSAQSAGSEAGRRANLGTSKAIGGSRTALVS